MRAAKLDINGAIENIILVEDIANYPDYIEAPEFARIGETLAQSADRKTQYDADRVPRTREEIRESLKDPAIRLLIQVIEDLHGLQKGDVLTLIRNKVT